MAFSVVGNKYLQTNLNRLSSGPATLVAADNIRIDGERVRGRIGQDLVEPEDPAFSSIVGTFETYLPVKIWWYNNAVWGWFVSPSDPDIIGYFDFATNQWMGSLTNSGLQSSWVGSDHQPPQIAEANRRLFVSQKNGIQCSPKLEVDERIGTDLTTLQTSLRFAGVPLALPIVDVSLVDTTGTYDSNWLSDGSRCAYRSVWKYVDPNGIEVYGPPSDRFEVENSVGGGALRAVQMTFYIPIPIVDSPAIETPRYSLEVYRTREVIEGPASITPDPGDECFMVAELRPTSDDITAGLMNFTDILPDIALQQPLYTNTTQEGLSQSRVRPNRSRSIEEFNGSLWTANIEARYENPFQLIAVNDASATTPRGLRNNDVVIAGDYCLQAKDPGTVTIPENQFELDTTTGVVNTFSRIQNTALRIAKLYNSNFDRPRFDIDTITDPDGFGGYLVLKEFYDGTNTANCKPYFGLYRENGWATLNGNDPCPISPSPLVGFDALNNVVGRGFKITKIEGFGTGIELEFTLDSPPDFLVGDTVNLSSMIAYLSPLLPPTEAGDGIFRFTPGQYIVSSISGSIITLTGVTGSASAFTVEAGTDPFKNWDLLGAMHCVYSKSIGMNTASTPENNVFKNRLYYSPRFEPESAPALNYFDIGASDMDIIKLFRLGESLFVFKQDGLFRVRGSYPNYFVEQFDRNIILSASDAISSIGSSAFCLTDRGVYEINEVTSSRISYDIQNMIDPIIKNNGDAMRRLATMVANNDDQSVTLWLPNFNLQTRVASTKNDIAFVFDGNGWTVRTDEAIGACVGRNTKDDSDTMSLYTIKGLGSAWLTKSRRANNGTDYCDERLNVPVSSLTIVDPLLITVDILSDAAPNGIGSQLTNALVGAVVVPNQPSSQFQLRAYVDSVTHNSGSSYKLTLGFYDQIDISNWDTLNLDSIDIYLPYNVRWRHNINVSEDPTIRKHFSEVSAMFQQPYFLGIETGFATDVNPQMAFVDTMRGFQHLNLNPTTWELLSAEDQTLQDKTIKCIVHQDRARCSQISIQFSNTRAMEFISCYGYILRHDEGGATIERGNGLRV